MKIRELAGAVRDLGEALTYYTEFEPFVRRGLVVRNRRSKKNHCAISAGMAFAGRGDAALRSASLPLFHRVSTAQG